MNIAQRAGRWVFEQWLIGRVVWPGLPRRWRGSWLDVRNRGESVAVGTDAESRVCTWEWSSYLTACRMKPRWGGQLLRACLKSDPVALRQPDAKWDVDASPRLSVVIPFRGGERMEQLLCVLDSFAGQDSGEFEIVVVTESGSPLPPPWRRRRLRCVVEEGAERFPKCRFLNTGVRHARAEYVLLHDADIAVPASYVRRLLARLDAGWEAVQPLRFLFYLEESDTVAFIASKGETAPSRVTEVRQNFAGGSVAIRRSRYWAIGGMNESFAGWGLEDVEFQQRLQTLRSFHGRYAAALHLWHPAARQEITPGNQALFQELSEMTPAERIERLLAERDSPEIERNFLDSDRGGAGNTRICAS